MEGWEEELIADVWAYKAMTTLAEEAINAIDLACKTISFSFQSCVTLHLINSPHFDVVVAPCLVSYL